ncbi:MAG: RlmE family RNA methyltransferase [Deltaproteobacteria bacterium]|nr:RlmE family RNA methyltransferase [Deltaproteobacteria bacterium]
MPKTNKWDDHYTARARQEKWLARSVYKLEEIDKKHRIIQKNDRILDLGCYPGSWSQYCVHKVGPHGDVVGVDLQRPTRFSAPNFTFIEADILSLETIWLKKEVKGRRAILSDMAPRTTGVRSTDTIQSLALAEKALEIAVALLEKNGSFLCKVFEGEDFKSFRTKVSTHFKDISIMRPSAVRKRSREVFLIGLKFIQ